MKIALAAALALAACKSSPSADPELVRLTVRKLASEAYPRWAMNAPSAAACPSLSDLGAILGPDIKLTDPWGEAYVVRCRPDLPPGADGIAILSKGPDKKPDTADDITSWK